MFGAPADGIANSEEWNIRRFAALVYTMFIL
jgi:hypothetical protein